MWKSLLIILFSGEILAVYQGPGCGECVSENVWNDVIYLIDSSDASQNDGVNDIWTYVLTVSQWFNIQKSNTASNSSYMEVGVISYSDDAEVVAPLGTVDYMDMLDITIPYLAGVQNNIDIAIYKAMQQFTLYGRTNSRKIIVLIAVSYNGQGQHDPKKAADTFKEDGGIIIVLDYVPKQGSPAVQISGVASPGYFLYSPNSSVADMVQAQCDANCFCPNGFKPYSSHRNIPNYGCYYPVTLQASFVLANKNCQKNYKNGYLASVQTEEKQSFLKNLIDGTDLIIGLSNINSTWIWSDGTSLGDYHPYSHAPNSSDIFYIPFNQSHWYPAESRAAFFYICETTPCSVTNVCNDFN